MKQVAIAMLLLAACADRALPDNAASMASGGSAGSAGAGGSSGAGGMGSGGSGGIGDAGGGSGMSGSGGEGGRAMPDASRSDGGRRDAGGTLLCGQIVQCGLNCGQNVQCFQMCCQMGTQQACQDAQQLIFCAVQNCSSSLGNLPQLLQCLGMHCQMQVSNCSGLPF